MAKPKGGVAVRRRVDEDAATQHACELKRVHSQLRELADSKNSVDDEDPCELPIDYDHDKNFHGHCFLPDLEGVDDLRHETNPVTAATYSINRIERGTTRLTQQRYEHLKPFFLNASKKVIENAINATTQHANDLLAGPTIKNVHRSRNPACNGPRRAESVSTDMVHSDSPAVDNGCKLAQVYVGRRSYVADAF